MRSVLLTLASIASALHISPICRTTTIRCCLPPALRDADNFARGTLDVDCDTLQAFWRQDPETVQVVVAMPEESSFKRDVKIDVSRKRISLAVLENEILVGDLAYDVKVENSEWMVEADLDGFNGDKFLVVTLRKHESYVDWEAPLRDASASSAPKRILLGGTGEAQKQATAQQYASYQIMQKLPSATRGDVYARVPPSADGTASDTLYFIGKVIAEQFAATASLSTQELLVKSHARVYQPDVFSDVSDEDMELWLAPGNTEMRVAQNEVALKRWEAPAAEVALPAPGACGFEPETPPPPHMTQDPFTCKRDAEGQPLGSAVKFNTVKPDEVPGAYGKWLADQ